MPESVPQARQAVVDLATEIGANEDQVDAVRLATSEALTNAVLHAYDGAPGLIHVVAALCGQRLSVTVADDGGGLSPRVGRRGIGLGLALMAGAAQELSIAKRPGGGTALQMRFELSPRT